MSKAHTGKTLAPETKQKISEANLGKTRTPETKQKMSEANSGEKNYMYGKNHTPETKQKMSESQSGEKHPMFGKNHTKESKQKMSEAKTGDKNHKSKKVYQYTIDGTYVNDFGSSEEAARALGKKSGGQIRACACGDCESAYGFKWLRTEL